MNKISYSEFAKLNLKVGLIKEVENHPNADKLFVLKVDLGENPTRTIVAGLKGFYSAEELKGRKAIFVSNLESVKLRGAESSGMILAAVSEDKNKVVFITPEKDMAIGAKIS